MMTPKEKAEELVIAMKIDYSVIQRVIRRVRSMQIIWTLTARLAWNIARWPRFGICGLRRRKKRMSGCRVWIWVNLLSSYWKTPISLVNSKVTYNNFPVLFQYRLSFKNFPFPTNSLSVFSKNQKTIPNPSLVKITNPSILLL